ncbi:MAG TPA: RNA 2',3'-cyclic phosphodiesterase [Dehalococcoidia bacterium]|nr:RNA 2',3'-cyclic phosphodiesterase [Dehalococcoidia bacterium]
MTARGEAGLRLFVALELSPAWLQELERAQNALRAALEGRGVRPLRWVRPEGIHLTLKFLGSVPESRLEAVRGAIRSASSDFAPISLVLAERLNAFGDRRGPRVIWAGLDGASAAERGRLYRLVEDLETSFAAAGFPREGRFQPHLTLARVPEDFSRAERAAVAAASEEVRLAATPPLVSEAISLMRSHIGPGGARYERLQRFP